jgi:hypothetical protein
MDESQFSSLDVGGVLVGRAEAGKVLPEVSLRLLKTTWVWASAIEAIVFPTADIADLVAAKLGKGREFTTRTAVHTYECRPVLIVVLVEPSIGQHHGPYLIKEGSISSEGYSGANADAMTLDTTAG